MKVIKAIGKGFGWIASHFFIFAVLLFAGALAFTFNTGTVAYIGEKAGNLAGTASGSVAGVMETPKAIEEGVHQGLSAEDTIANIGSLLDKQANLEVLSAEVDILNLHTKGENYAALFQIPKRIVFTVDLTKQETKCDGNRLEIIIPHPNTYLEDNGEEILIAEYDPDFWTKIKHNPFEVLTDSSENGVEGYENSAAEVQKQSQEELQKTLLPKAEDAAREQVKLLAKSACGDRFNLIVSFKDGE